ncbi:MAG: 3-isopropylmalate dehydrogenase [Actinomycetota bacterium]|nr:3-isopropylmalate dehydrogenase [Actinomycetota bacterium]
MHKIALIGGDGIGPEVVDEAMRVVGATKVPFTTSSYDLGAARYIRDKVVLPDETLAELRGFDAIMLGAIGPAIGSKEVPPGILERGLLLKLRFELDLYINHRPFITPPGGSGGRFEDVDFVVIRENTEGTYAGEGGLLRRGTPNEIATQGSVNTRFGVERAIRYAFDLARSRPRKHLTLVHKTNVLTFSGDLWQRTFDEVASEYPDVSTAYNHVDAACIYMVDSPSRYDVVVTDNLFGDIITDLAGAISGGIGHAASANLNPARTGPSLFEPVHGAAHDIVGTGKANPIAAIRSAALMLEFLGEAKAAKAIFDVLGNYSPAPTMTTAEIGKEIAERVANAN